MGRPRQQHKIRVTPAPWQLAVAFTALHHRHHSPPQGHRFSLAAWSQHRLVGVAIVGRPVSRHLQAQGAWEVTRLTTDGTPNACSALYAAANREARRRGCPRLVTYTLATEPGTSLKAAGWQPTATTHGRAWHCPSRPRTTPNLGKKTRWDAP